MLELNDWLMWLVPLIACGIGILIGQHDRKTPTVQKVGKIITAKDEEGTYFYLEFYSDEDMKYVKSCPREVLLDVTRIN